MTFEEEFSEAYKNWEIEKIYLDLADAVGKDLSPNAKIFLRGILCANSPNEIAKKLNYQGKNISDTVRQTLSKEVYPAIENLVNSGNKINWRKTSENSVSQLLKEYRKKTENSPLTSTEIKINWREVCAKMLEKQQTTQQLRRKATQIGCEVEVFVKLGLVERKLQQHHSDNNGMEKLREKEVITRTYEYDEFLLDVIQGKKNKLTAIVGEAGSGKTTWLDKIANNLKNTNDLYICIPLGDLQGKTLEEYILKKWLSNAMLLIDLDIDSATFEKKLTKLLQKDEVWLLLDGVDEIGEISAGKTLRNIQQQLTGFLSAAQVVLTCRTNIWDVNFNHPLSGFETYKTLEFKFEQVDDFIHQWFLKAENKKRGEKLGEKLKESRHKRIYDLVRNPLRLSLLCQIFYFDENAELPETKAGLYQQFIRYFYEWKPEKIGIDWNVQPNLKNQLHQALGKVALAGLDSLERFRLSESLIHKEIQDDKLFNLALDLDLLVLVDREIKTGEFVYGFFHPTFQEYFASLVIPNWEFLFNHIPGDISNSTYRIFHSYWQEVALMWMESENFSAADGEKFFNIFDDFESDKCLDFYAFQIFPFMVAALYRLGDYYQCQDILKKSIFYLIYHIDFNAGLNQFIPFCFDSLFFEILKVLPHITSNLLSYCLNDQKFHDKKYQDKRFKITKILFEISPNKEAVLDKVAEFLQLDDSITLEAAKIILKYDNFHPKATSILIELFLSNEDENECISIIKVLLDNKSINQEIISEDVLIKLLSFLFSEYYNIRLFTSSQLNELSDFGVIDFDNDDEFLEIISLAMIEYKAKIVVVFNILNLLEKLEVDNRIDDAILIRLIYPEEEHLVIDKALKLLEKRDISSEMIDDIICLYLYADEMVEIKVFLLVDFARRYSILNPQKFTHLELLRSLVIMPLEQHCRNMEKDLILYTISVINIIISRDKNILNSLITLRNNSNEQYVIESADSILNAIRTNMFDFDLEMFDDNDDDYESDQLFNEIQMQQYKKFNDFLQSQEKLTLESSENIILSNIDYAIANNQIDTLKKFLERIKQSKDAQFCSTLLYTLTKLGAFLIPQILEKAINFIVVTENPEIPYQVALAFTEITEVEQLKVMVANLKEYVEKDFYMQEEKFVQNEVYNYDFTRYIVANEIVWHCAQHMSYPDFHNAWYSPSSTTHPETTDNIPVINSTTIQHLNLTQLPITLHQNIANNPDFNQTIIPICIDGANFTNPDNPAPDIYIEMIEKGCPEITPTPTTMSSLKTYWRLNLKKLDKQIALIFYTSKSDRSFSKTFITSLSTLGNSICLISDQKCDNIESISPHHPNLIDTIIQWLRR